MNQNKLFLLYSPFSVHAEIHFPISHIVFIGLASLKHIMLVIAVLGSSNCHSNNLSRKCEDLLVKEVSSECL